MVASKYCTTLDLWSTYTADKTVLVTRRGKCKLKVLLYGMTDSPAGFQRLMDLVLSGLI